MTDSRTVTFLDLPNPTPVITLLKPKALTYCDCDYDGDGPLTFEHQAQEIDYKLAFTSPDGDVALFSTTGKAMDIFTGFDSVFREKPNGKNEVLYFGCHDPRAFT